MVATHACILRYGSTALHVASYHGQHEIVQLLLDNFADTSIQPAGGIWAGKTAMDLAAESRYYAVANTLSRYADKVSAAQEYAWSACRSRNEKELSKALAMGINPNWQNDLKGGMTLLMRAAIEGWNWGIAELQARGADVNLGDNFGSTALHVAVHYDQVDTVAFLLTLNANVQLAATGGGWTGETPHNIAIANDNQQIIDLLSTFTIGGATSEPPPLPKITAVDDSENCALAKLVAQLGIAERVLPIFEEHNINSTDVVSELSKEELRSIGLTLGDAHKLHKAVCLPPSTAPS